MKSNQKTSEWKVEVRWTDWIDDDSREWEKRGALYLYGTDTESLYIGKAGGKTVLERYEGHEKDGILKCVRSKIGEPLVKVGHLYAPKGIENDRNLFYDVETLLILLERKQRHKCYCNVQSTGTRNNYREGMIVVNLKCRAPLLYEYHDEYRGMEPWAS